MEEKGLEGRCTCIYIHVSILYGNVMNEICVADLDCIEIVNVTRWNYWSNGRGDTKLCVCIKPFPLNIKSKSSQNELELQWEFI